MHTIKEKLIIFVKAPIPGKVKTRLARHIGMANAVLIYNAMVNDLKKNLISLKQDIIYFLNDLKYRYLLFPDDKTNFHKNKYLVKQQTGNDLGEKMINAFLTIFNEGTDHVLLIGSDIPHISGDLISHYFLELAENQAVIGPANDGGYYLIGFQKDAFFHDIFKQINWSSDKVFSQTIARIKRCNLTYYTGPVYQDLDTFTDLKEIRDQLQWEKYLIHLHKAFDKISEYF